MSKIKTLVIDGNYMLFQSFYATYKGDINAILRTTNGIPTNAISVFLSQLIKLLKFIRPTHLLIAFDFGTKTKRHQIFPEYKLGRVKAPQEVFQQMDLIKQLLSKLNIQIFQQEGDEADDIIGTYCDKLPGEKFIFSSDRDLLQLVNKDTNYIIKKASDISLITNDNFYNIFQIYPNQITSFKGLKGDSSDNLPGVKGIGEKTAIKLLNDYLNFENIYQNLDNQTLDVSNSIIKKLQDGKRLGYLSYELSKINLDVMNLPTDEKIYKINLDYESAKEMIHYLELRTFEIELLKYIKNDSDSR
ncbi:5'-3' exonuclease H3TH domain-containing protein [Mycoplasmopsis cynos]|uniref:5'-3' exonuclease n=1 Tax=Mycoplasmopsis cynos TaxID=171284 RepID=UPI002AFF72B0|nr:5'-3' exonuclease H3TH domain-containing protein [Mycoplasmopsis cynos]WQQ16682.1 5'-3' exonuclease H3TH domain-containing protein [Mycoplasmopsis cynos]